MNRICIWLLAAASAVCLCMLPRTGTDAAKLLPAQVLVIGAGDGALTVEADTGAAGSGPPLAAALADMAECAVGTLFLDTAEHSVLLQSAGALLPAAAQQPQFRPAAKLYLARLPELPSALPPRGEEGTCYPNLPSDADLGISPRQTVESLVLSLCSLDTVERVQIVVAGEIAAQLNGVNVGEPLTP